MPILKATNPLSQPISVLSGIGPQKVTVLKRLGIETLADVLHVMPVRYDSVIMGAAVAELKEGALAAVDGVIVSIRARQAYKRRRLFIVEAVIDSVDGETIRATWFNQPYVAKQFESGDAIRVVGKLVAARLGLGMTNPSYEKLGGASSVKIVGAMEDGSDTSEIGIPAAAEYNPHDELLAVYPLTAGVTQKQFRSIVKKAFTAVDTHSIPDTLSPELIKSLSLPSLESAIQTLHTPKNLKDAEAARNRLIFDQLLVNQMAVAEVKKQNNTQTSPALMFHRDEIADFVHSLPFALTDDQRKAAWKILQDTEREMPMNRLLIGDVGSGKTVVAAVAAYNAVLNGFQVALMAPTEILAQQHARTFELLFAHTDVNIEIRTSRENKGSKSTSAKKQKALTADIIIGTHAIIQDAITFRRLGLAIVDEQHRFGVMQRKRLIEEGELGGLAPHFLSMSATPIPRTLALSLYGDVDLTTITQMPGGRKPVETSLIESDAGYFRTLDTMDARITKGEQCFVLCPLIEDSELLAAASVETITKELQESILGRNKRRIVALHGKMKPTEKDAIMKKMKEKKIDVLVSTTVIEVGIDIPDATVMMIINGERFGLSQLHQLRGRVGRSDKQSYCFIDARDAGETARERLTALTKEHRGIALAEIDLKLRGAGDVYGIKQSGIETELTYAFEYPQILELATHARDIITPNPEWRDSLTLLGKKVDAHIARLHFE